MYWNNPCFYLFRRRFLNYYSPEAARLSELSFDWSLRSAQRNIDSFYYIQMIEKHRIAIYKMPRVLQRTISMCITLSVLPIYSPLGNSEILSWLICLRPTISRYSVLVYPAHHDDANSMSRPPDRMQMTLGKCWHRNKDLKISQGGKIYINKNKY